MTLIPVQGRLYGNVDTSSTWQLEPRPSARERATSTTSTASTHSSYAFVSDPEISSSFAASLESGQVSDAEEGVAPSPGLSSPVLTPAEGFLPFRRRHANSNVAISRSVSPGHVPHSVTSSSSSLESLHSLHSGRLLTLHLEKEQSIIWPSLIVGPVPDTLSPFTPVPVAYDSSHELEHKYNMDPTSLVMIGLELFDIRKDREEAFEYFMCVPLTRQCFTDESDVHLRRRAWHQAHAPSATMRLASHYLPVQTSFELIQTTEQASPGAVAYYLQGIGGPDGLARLYLEAGLLHLDGAASSLLSPSHSTLSSIRMPAHPQPGQSGAETWRRDREAAIRYFERARVLQPNLDVPLLTSEGDDPLRAADAEELEMPSIELYTSSAESVHSESYCDDPSVRRRRKKEEQTLFDNRRPGVGDIDNAWYVYIPGLVGAGTALLVVGVIGALSLSTWRRNQGS
jgi:thiamine pyrophosphokinase